MDHSDGRTILFPPLFTAFFTVITLKCNSDATSIVQGIKMWTSYFFKLCLKTSFSSGCVRLVDVNKLQSARFVILLLVLLNRSVLGYNFTDQVFEGNSEGLIAAFGDFNSDKLTDTFVISQNKKSFSILLSHSKPPYLRNTTLNCTFNEEKIVSLVPGDFDGDAAMDVVVLVESAAKIKSHLDVYIAWGNLSALECPTTPLFEMIGHPLMLDYNSDMISDLFGLDEKQLRSFWIFGSNRTVESKILMNSSLPLRNPHSHSFVDLDGDMAADLLLTGQDSFEFWRYTASGFEFNRTIDLPVKNANFMGQSVFVDVNFNGFLEHLVPVCVDSQCRNSSLYLYSAADDRWLSIECDLNEWKFVHPDQMGDNIYGETITARAGDVDLDGYPDLLMTLTHGGKKRAVLLENLPSSDKDSAYSRKFVAKWSVLSQWNDTLMATFYDIQQKGVLDVLMVQQQRVDGQYQMIMSAYKNDLDYDANFIKVLVLTGRCYGNCTYGQIPYGTNLPGPFIGYRTVNSAGQPQEACSTQLFQSAYHSLQLPYSLFGLGHTPNFVETLRVGVAFPDDDAPQRRSREWTQIIPNSQMIIIPNLEGEPSHWLNKLFVTPSRAVALSAGALIGFGAFLAILVVVLHIRERREDKREQAAIAYRFHFDAM